ncbi:MAG: Fe-S cluster assembly ATPase SufC [bacterium]|nr:Fe-S cluster assembly ATPase SufC [bacterium]
MKLEINNLHAKITETDEKILNGVTLTINKGETHAFMGPNGSGKSTLANVLMGNPEYTVTLGTVKLNGVDIFALTPDERAKQGLFLAFQYPTEIPGVPIRSFLLKAYNAVKKTAMSPKEFIKLVSEKAKLVNISDEILKRNLNEGFSGGEKKKLEIMQLAVLSPNFAILDETDSGLDVDALKNVSDAINAIQKESKIGLILITHYQRILKYVKPDFVHIFKDGQIIKSGDYTLAEQLENTGYTDI